MRVKITKKSDNKNCWYNEFIGSEFQVLAGPYIDGENDAGLRERKLVVMTPFNCEGVVWESDYKVIEENYK